MSTSGLSGWTIRDYNTVCKFKNLVYIMVEISATGSGLVTNDRLTWTNAIPADYRPSYNFYSPIIGATEIDRYMDISANAFIWMDGTIHIDNFTGKTAKQFLICIISLCT